MNLVKPSEMYSLEKKMQSIFDLQSFTLMENAAINVIDEILVREKTLNDKLVVVFVGTGSNGGDGLAVSRWLYTYGARVFLYVMGDRNKLGQNSLKNLKLISQVDVETFFSDECLSDRQILDIKRCDFIVDAIFGIGLNRNVSDSLGRTIDAINSLGKKVYSIDVPSGLNAYTGKKMGSMIKADCVISFEYAKSGLYLQEGRDSAKEIIVKPLGFPVRFDATVKAYEYKDFFDIKEKYFRRTSCSHKGSYGRVMCICGSDDMPGAAILACLGASNSGAGLVYIASSRKVIDSVIQRDPEVIGVNIEGDNILDRIDNMDAIVIGPGLGKNNKILESLEEIIEKFKGNIVIDADALYHTEIKELKENVVITPHLKEAANIFNTDIELVQDDMIGFVEKNKGNYTLVLKSNGTIVAKDNNPISINTSGNPGMSRGGSGDVLSGIIGGILAQNKLSIFEAVKFAVYLHGLAADLCERDLGHCGVKPSVYADYIVEAFKGGQDKKWI